MNEIKNVGLGSKDLVAERVEEMRELFPEAFTEDGIDFDKLRLILGDEVDEGEERYAFTWPGKAAAIRQSQTVSIATLRPCEEESVSADGTPGSWEGTENLYIEGDNLEVLKLLQAGYHGKVKLIYIDPPYNTGHDFVYKDKFGDTIENYKEQTAQADQSNPETAGRYHANWCSMMYPRLRLARELLSDDGAIFISIDDREVANLRNVADEIFGADGFIAQVAVINNLKGRNDKKGIALCHEYLCIYQKSLSFEPLGLPLSEEKQAEYNLTDELGHAYQLRDLRKRGNGDRREDRPNMFYPIFFNEATGEKSLDYQEGWIEITPHLSDGADGRWRWGKETAQLGLPIIEPYYSQTAGGWRVSYRVYLDPSDCPVQGLPSLAQEERREKPKSFWTGPEFSTDVASREVKALLGTGVFDTPKPRALIRNAVEMVAKDGDVVLDFFSGSATTSEALMRSNLENGIDRRFILVQLPEPCGPDTTAYKNGYKSICEIGKERIRRAGKKIAAEVDEANQQLKLGEELKKLPDIGFRVLKLDESNIVRPEPGQLLVDVVKPGRTELDIVFECMLKWGLEPSLPVERAQAAGYPVWEVAAGELVCCMAPGLTVEALEAVAAMEPRRVLILDSVLDDTLKLNAKAIFDRGCADGTEIELRTV